MFSSRTIGNLKIPLALYMFLLNTLYFILTFFKKTNKLIIFNLVISSCCAAALSGGVRVPAAHHLLRVGLDRNVAARLQSSASGGRRRKQWVTVARVRTSFSRCHTDASFTKRPLCVSGYLSIMDATERAPLMYPGPVSDGQFYSPPESVAGLWTLTDINSKETTSYFCVWRESVYFFKLFLDFSVLYLCLSVAFRLWRGAGW